MALIAPTIEGATVLATGALSLCVLRTNARAATSYHARIGGQTFQRARWMAEKRYDCVQRVGALINGNAYDVSVCAVIDGVATPWSAEYEVTAHAPVSRSNRLRQAIADVLSDNDVMACGNSVTLLADHWGRPRMASATSPIRGGHMLLEVGLPGTANVSRLGIRNSENIEIPIVIYRPADDGDAAGEELLDAAAAAQLVLDQNLSAAVSVSGVPFRGWTYRSEGAPAYLESGNVMAVRFQISVSLESVSC